MGWIKAKDRLPEKWERVAVLSLNETEPRISHIDQRNYFDAAGRTFAKTVWVGIEKQVLYWASLPKLPKEWS